MKIIDISPVITSEIAVWPGDTPYVRKVLMDTDAGDHLGLSQVTTTLHLGAHTDAPNHYAPNSEGIGERSLHYYIGPAQVVDCVTPAGSRVELADLQGVSIKSPRVLFKTGSFPDPNHWNEDFCGLSPELVDTMAAQGALLLGIDTPSVDLFDCKQLLAHKRVQAHNMSILEGIDLSQAPAGLYHLVALPLPLKGADASPVRAVLLPYQIFNELDFSPPLA